MRDDGQGIDFEKLRRKAIEKGFLTKDAQPDRKTLLLIMLKSGISTLEQVNEDAGQGVGTDVIVSRLRELNGKVFIDTETNSHTCFKVFFPILSDD